MIDIISEPNGQIYFALLLLAQKYCTSFSLVWRDQMKFNDSAKKMEIALRPFLIREEYVSEWPGTRLLNSKAWVRYYTFTNETRTILAKVHSLYGWLSPDFPEDLAIYTVDGQCWLMSITHEKDSAIVDELILLEEIRESVPDIEVCVHNP